MPRIDNLDRRNPTNAVQVRQKATEVMAPLGSTAVSTGSTRFIGLDSLLVQGSAKVTGTLQVDGILNADGTITLSGATTLTGDLSVEGGGQIVIDGSIPMQIGASAFGIPGVSFDGGGGLVGNGASGVLMFSGASVGSGAGVVVSNSGASMEMGSKSVSVSGTGTTVEGGIDFASLPTTPAAGKTANAWIDPSTKILYRMI